ncbi:MAG: hypothetical protein LHV68_05105 [Elusimicrobia bacterium]|nr:hypothetical protein [Candidatus Liberimonas magnetica]
MAEKFRTNVEKGLHRIPLTLSKEVDEWLYHISSEMKSRGGYKLPRTYIIRCIVRAAMKLKLDLNEIKDEKELEKRIITAIKKYK